MLDLNPSLTSRSTACPTPTAVGDYTGGGPELGGSVRWGITNNLNLNGTANPDFSQVESDAGQFQFDPRRRALLFREAAVLPRRQRAVQHAEPADLYPAYRPAGGRGQARRQGLRHRYRAAVGGGRRDGVGDWRSPGVQPPAPAARPRRQSRVGLVYTDRVEGAELQSGRRSGRPVRHGRYSAQFQAAGSRTRTAGAPPAVRCCSGGSSPTVTPSASAPPSTVRIRISAREAASFPGQACPA